MEPSAYHPPTLLYAGNSLVSLFGFGVGLRGILTRKPFLLSARWIWGVFLVGLLPHTVQPLYRPVFGITVNPNAFLIVLHCLVVAFAVAALVLLIKLRSYTVLGITNTSLYEGVESALERLNIPYEYEQNSSNIHLPSIGASLRLSKPSGGGSQIGIRPRRFNRVLRDVVKEMGSFYQNTNVSANPAAFYYYLLLSGLLAAQQISYYWLSY
jgi:hypothetical protein